MRKKCNQTHAYKNQQLLEKHTHMYIRNLFKPAFHNSEHGTNPAGTVSNPFEGQLIRETLPPIV